MSRRLPESLVGVNDEQERVGEDVEGVMKCSLRSKRLAPGR